MLSRHHPVRPRQRNKLRNPRREVARLFRSQRVSRPRPQQQPTILGVTKKSLTILSIGNQPIEILGMVNQSITTLGVGKQLTAMAAITQTPCAAIGMNDMTTIGGNNTM